METLEEQRYGTVRWKHRVMRTCRPGVTEPHDTLFPTSDPVEKILQSLLTSGGRRLEEIKLSAWSL